MSIYNEAIRLAKKFCTEIKGFEVDGHTGRVKADEQYKMKIIENMAEYLNGGTEAGVLEWMMERYKEQCEEHESAYNMDDIFSFFHEHAPKKPLEDDPENLLQPGRFYYHRILQVAPPPPVLCQLPDGTFKASYEEEEFYLEIRERFTLDDLVDYFNEVMERTNSEFTRERDKGAFKHLLKQHDLDVILYTIDEAKALAVDYNRPIPKTPFDIQEYIDDGKERLEDRMNRCYMGGIDRVIPRTRHHVR